MCVRGWGVCGRSFLNETLGNTWHRSITFISGREAFANPAAAAAELQPQVAVSGDDGLRERVSTKATCRETDNKERKNK